MRFWQKAFLGMLVIFLLCLDLFTFTFMRRSVALVTDAILEMAESERAQIEAGLINDLIRAEGNFERFNKDNLEQFIAHSAERYAGQGTSLIAYCDGELSFTNAPGGDPRAFDPAEKGSGILLVDGVRYAVLETGALVPYGNIRLVYIKNVENIAGYERNMLAFFVWASLLTSVLLAALVIALLLHMTRPLRQLSDTARQIAAGDYTKRVSARGGDEIAEFSAVFNQMADSVQAQVEALDALSQERQRFIDNLGHELRTPITAIMGYGEYLKFAKARKDDRLRATDYIIEQSKRIRNLSEKMMNLSRLQQGQIALEPVPIKGVVESAVRTLQGPIREKEVRLAVSIEEMTLPGDADLLETLVQNLAENAIRALDKGQALEIRGEKAGEGFRLTVRDEGIGMDEAELEKVREPFYRVDPSRSRANGGVGLGLSLCKEICAVHRAALHLTSAPGKGTTATVVFEQADPIEAKTADTK